MAKKNKKPKRFIDMDLFRDADMVAISATAKALFVYLLLPSPSGINNLSIRQMRNMVDARLSDEAMGLALGELCDAGIARWDPQNEVVWLVRALEQQASGASCKIGRHVQNHLYALPRSPLVEQFLEYYHDWFVRAEVIEPGSSVPPIRLVEPSFEAQPSKPQHDTLSPTSISIPSRIPEPEPEPATAEPETEAEAEAAPAEADSRGPLGRNSSREQPEREGRTTAPSSPSRAGIEQEVERIVVEAGIAGTCPGSSFLSPAVERVMAREATLDDVRAITAEFKRRREKGDTGLRHWPTLFYEGKSWARTSREYLLRKSSGEVGGRRLPTSALSRLDAHWGEIAAASPPEVPPTLEQLTQDEKLLDSLLAGTTLDRSAGC